MRLKAKKPIFDGFEGPEVIRRENLAVDDREVDLDLVEPTRVHGAVHRYEARVPGRKATDAPVASVRGPIVQDPEHPPGLAVGGLGHHLVDEAIERYDAGGAFAAAEELRAVDVEGGQIRPGTTSGVLVFDRAGSPGRGGRLGCLRLRA